MRAFLSLNLIAYSYVSAQQFSDLVSDFSTQLEGIMCDGIRVGGDKCSNGRYGIQDFIDSFINDFEGSTSVTNATFEAQKIINRLNDKLLDRSLILVALSSIIQLDCTNFDPYTSLFDDLYFAGNLATPANLPPDMAPSAVYGTNVSFSASTYKLPNGVSSDNENIQYDAVISQLLDNTMSTQYTNYCIDSQGVHEYCSIYYATINGVFRQYPGVENAEESGNYVDYDPRLEEYYVSAVSGSKDVVILFDISSAMSDNMALAKSAVSLILNTLGTDSFVNVIAFSDSLSTSCFADLVSATTRNKAQLNDFVDGLVASAGTADFAIAFTASFDILSTGESCNKAIIFLTQGDGIDVTDLVLTLNTDAIDATIFSYTMGDEATPNVPKSVAEATNGIYTHIDAADDNVIAAISSYYLYYTHGQPSSSTVRISSPFVDPQSGVVLVSMSMPVFIDDTYFAGVVGTDIPLTALSDAVGEITLGHKSYTFVMNEESELLLHPLISAPSELFDSATGEYKPIYVSDAEPDAFADGVLAQMLRRENGYKAVSAQVKLPAGNVIYNGYRTELAELLYIYAGVSMSPLSIAVVIYTDLTTTAPNVPAFGMVSVPNAECAEDDAASNCVAPFNMYHRVDKFMADECDSSWLSQADIVNGSDSGHAYADLPVNAFYEGKLYSVQYPIYFLQSGLWELEQDALTTDPSCTELNELHKMANQDGSYNVKELPYDGIRDEISNNILNGIYTLTQLHQFWKPSVIKNDSLFSSVWFGQYQGLHISYPGKVFNPTYNNLGRPWYQRAVSYPDEFVWVTPYAHSNTGKLIIGGSAVITAPNRDYPYGVTAFGAEYAVFVDYWKSIMDTECDTSTTGAKCYLIDSSGFLLYYDGMESDASDSDINIKFLGDFEPTLMQSLLDRGFFISEQNVNFAKDTNDISYIVESESLEPNRTFASNDGRYTVYAVAKTNLYVIHIENYGVQGQYPDDCPTNALCTDVQSPGCITETASTDCASATVDVCTAPETSLKPQDECPSEEGTDIGACILRLGLESDSCASDFEGISCEETTIENLVEIFSNQLESVMCDGLRVGGEKCSNGKTGIQDFVDSFVDHFEGVADTFDASEKAQDIIDRLQTKLTSRIYVLGNMSEVIQNQCEDGDELSSVFEELYFAGNMNGEAVLPDDMTLSAVYGTDVSLTKSTYTMPNSISNPNDDIKADAQISFLLDDTMRTLHDLYCVDSENIAEYCSMYFGSVNGLYRQYPGIESTKEDGSYVDVDPRFEPWYVSAVSKSKDIVILLDISDAMADALPLAQSAVTAILNSMGTGSFVTVIAFSDELTESCFEDDLVPTTSRNKAKLIDFVSSLEVSSGSNPDFESALNEAFNILTSSTTTPCNNAIILVTHASQGEDTDVTDVVLQRNTDTIDATIFSYTVGDESAPNMAVSVAEVTDGVYTHIDEDNLNTAVSSYYLYYVHGGGSGSTIRITSPYLDAQSGVVLVSMSMPVFIDDTYFAGVVGTDIPLTALSDAIGDVTFGHKSYTFVMNEETQLLLHPLISAPSKLFDSATAEYKPIYVSDAEPQAFTDSVLPQILNNENGYESIAAQMRLPAGNVVYNGYRTELAELLYIYAALDPAAALSIAVVLYTELDTTAPNVPAFGMKSSPSTKCSANSIDLECVAPFNMYHRVDKLMADECSSSWLSDAAILNGSDASNPYYDSAVNAFYSDKLYSVENPIYFLQSGLWELEQDALNTDPSCDELNELHKMATQEGSYDVQGLPYDGIRDEIKDNILNGIYTLTQLHQYWKAAVLTNDLKFSSVWFGQYQGLHISYPGKVFKATYNNLIRPWYQRAVSYPDSFVWVTPYKHANTGKLIIGGSAVITAPNRDYPYGVTAFGAEYTAFVNYWKSIMSAECDISLNKKCYLIDSSAFLLYYDGMEYDVDDDDISIKFLGSFEPTLMQSLLDRGFFIKETNVNFAADTNDISYIVNDAHYDYLVFKPTPFEYNSGNYTIHDVQKTNLFVIHIEGYQMVTQYPSDCPLNTACSGVTSPGCVLNNDANECMSATLDVCTQSETSIAPTNDVCPTESQTNIGACILTSGAQSDICATDFINIACQEAKEEGKELETWVIVVSVVCAVVVVIGIIIAFKYCSKKKGKAYIRANVADAGRTGNNTGTEQVPMTSAR